MDTPKEIFRVDPLNGVDMEEISIDELQGHLTKGTFTSLELTDWTLHRIERVCTRQ
jgi:hypothetical protein